MTSVKWGIRVDRWRCNIIYEDRIGKEGVAELTQTPNSHDNFDMEEQKCSLAKSTMVKCWVDITTDMESDLWYDFEVDPWYGKNAGSCCSSWKLKPQWPTPLAVCKMKAYFSNEMIIIIL
jgi:hypothetical protein